VITVWYFFYAKPVISPTLGAPNSSILSNILPKGFQFIGENGQADDTTSTTEVTPPGKQVFSKVWGKGAVGHTFTTREALREIEVPAKTGTSTVKQMVRVTINVLLFVDKITGYVYGYDLDTGEIFQISNTTLPGVYDAYIFNNGKSVVLRYIDKSRGTVVSAVADIPIVSPGQDAQGLQNMSYLPNGVSSVAVSKSGKLSYIVPNTGGSSIYTLSTKGSSLIANSTFRDWLLSYGGETLYVTAKPSAYVEGSMFMLPSFNLVEGAKTGLMANPSPEGAFLNSMWSSSGLRTYIKSKGTSVLSIATLASKCSWGNATFLICAVPQSLPNGSEGLPDDWLQGRVSFSDSLYVIDISSLTSYQLYTFDGAYGTFDVDAISVSPDANLVSLTKKSDGSLWVLNRSLISR
jgi:hypothetical protein